MIVQVCPNCLSTVELPDAAAGTTVACPKCQETFPVPEGYTPTVAGDRPAAPPAPEPIPMAPLTLPPTPAKPAPPPGFVPPADRPPPAAGAAAPPASDGTTYVLAPQVLDWLPVACFTAIFLLTFFNWVGLYPGGYRAYAQTPWGAVAGVHSTDPTSEEVLKIEVPLEKQLGYNVVILLPYLLLLILGVVVGWADRFVTPHRLKTLPGPLANVERIWPYRSTILTTIAVLTLLLLLLQLSVGFGLPNAAEQLVRGEYADRVAAAENTSARQKLLVEQGMELGKYNVRETFALTLVELLHVTAVVAAALRFWLARRGAKPLPRVTFWS